jgi:hypothetical protein
MFSTMTNPSNTKSRASQGMSLIEREVLIALFRLSRDTQHISARTLADQVSCTPTQTGAALVSLEQKGVVDASRARLTMKGLVLAARLGAGSGGPRVSLPKAVKAVATAQEALPVAALPSQPPPSLPSRWPSRSPAPSMPDRPSRSSYEEASISLHS